MLGVNDLVIHIQRFIRGRERADGISSRQCLHSCRWLTLIRVLNVFHIRTVNFTNLFRDHRVAKCAIQHRLPVFVPVNSCSNCVHLNNLSPPDYLNIHRYLDFTLLAHLASANLAGSSGNCPLRALSSTVSFETWAWPRLPPLVFVASAVVRSSWRSAKIVFIVLDYRALLIEIFWNLA